MNTFPFNDEEYGKILDHIVVTCVDVAVTHQGKILLVRRANEPIKNSWWLFGGRMVKGEGLLATAQRSIQRELSIFIDDVERFAETGVFNLIWPTRREPDTQNGCHHLLVAHHIELNKREKMNIDKLIENDTNYKWTDLSLGSSDNNLLPELRAIIGRLHQSSSRKRPLNIQRLLLR